MRLFSVQAKAPGSEVQYLAKAVFQRISLDKGNA